MSKLNDLIIKAGDDDSNLEKDYSGLRLPLWIHVDDCLQSAFEVSDTEEPHRKVLLEPQIHNWQPLEFAL